MRKILPFLVVLSLAAVQCSRDTPLPAGCIKGKVIRLKCNVVIQSLSNKSIGERNWKNIATGGVYNNVFRVSNDCELSYYLKDGEVIYFKFKDTQGTICGMCKTEDQPPKKEYDINRISPTPCP